MCLSKVDVVYKPPKKEIIGWKAFTCGLDGLPLFPLRRYRGKSEVPLNRWIKAKTRKEFDPTYERAFHIYATKKAAVKSSWGSLILPVLGREVTYKGREEFGTVYICRQMLVLFNPQEEESNAPAF